MTSIDAASIADQVREAVSSVVTCGPDTTKLLTLLLNPASNKSKPAQTISSLNRYREQDGPIKLSTRRINAPKTRVQQQSVEVAEEASPTLTSLGRVTLATEVVNRTLQVLTSLVKSRANGTSNEASATLPKRPLSSSQRPSTKALASKPLQSRSINRPSPNPSGKTTCATEEATRAQNAVALAECARVALSTLRRNISSNDGKSRVPPLQVNLGMSALISKLLALDMLDLATKELHILAKRLDMGCITDGPNFKNAGNPENQVNKMASDEKLTLIDFLYTTQPPNETATLYLVFTTQLQVLRLLGMKTKAFDGDTMLNALLSENKSSPMTILASLEERESREKIARSFANLSQTISDLGKRHKIHHSSNNNLGCKNACCCFRLQLLSVQCLQRSWELSGQKVSLVKEVIVPLTGCIDELATDDEVSAEQRVAVLESGFTEIDKILFGVESIGATKKQELDILRLHFYETLLSLSGKVRNLVQISERARCWVRTALTMIESTSPASARKCIVTCRAVILAMKHPDIEWNPILNVLLKRIVSSLDVSIEGLQHDLDELLSVLSNLRKLSIRFISSYHDSKSIETLADQETQALLYQLIMLCLDFLVRCRGPDPAAQDASVRRSHSGQEVLLSETTESNIENVLGIAKLNIVKKYVPWKVTNHALQNCVRLAPNTGFEKKARSTSNARTLSTKLRMRVSHIYWLKYLSLQQEETDFQTALDALQHSVSLLENASLKEQTTGIYGVKLEKLGNAHERSNQTIKAAKAYAGAIAHFSTLGLVNEAARECFKASTASVLSKDGYKTLRRVIEGFCRVSDQGDGSNADPTKQASNFRASDEGIGFLQETFLHHYTKLRSTKSYPEGASTAVLRLWESIRQADDKYSLVRRLRTLSTILEASLSEKAFVPADLIERESSDLLRETTPSTKRCNDLTDILQYYRAVAGAWLALSGKQLSNWTLDMTLRTWKELVSKFNGDWQAFKESFPYADQLPRLLDILANFLHVLNLDSDRAFVLHLSLAILSMSTANKAAPLSIACKLADSLTATGFIEEAEKILQRCDQPTDCNGYADLDRLDWHLALVEHSIAIGNPSRGSKHLRASQELFNKVAANEGGNFTKRSDLLAHLARLYQTISKLALAEGKGAKALYHSRRASSLLLKAWAILERREQRSKGVEEKPSLSRGFQNTDSESSDISTSQYVDQDRSISPAKLWCIGRFLFDCLLHLSTLLSAEGILSEAHFYADQALKTANRLKSPLLKARGSIVLGEMHLRSEQIAKGAQLLDEASATLDETSDGHETLQLRARLAIARCAKPSRDSIELIMSAAKMLGRLEPPPLFPSRPPSDGAKELVERMGNLDLVEKGAPRKRRSKTNLGENLSSAVGNGSSKIQQLQTKPTMSSTVVSSLYHEVIQRQCRAYLLQNKMEDAFTLLAEADSTPCGNEITALHQQLVKAQLVSKQSLKCLDTDPVLNILSESTLAYPTTLSSTERNPGNSESSHVPPKTPQAKKRGRAPAASKSKVQALDKGPSDFVESILESLEPLMPLPTMVQRIGSVSIMHETSHFMVKHLLTASAACSGVHLPGVAPTSIAHSIEIGRLNATARELSAIAVEKFITLKQDFDAIDLEAEVALGAYDMIDVHSFQSKYIDIIPEQWTAVSLSVSENCGDLRVCRFRSGSSPFVISIPLSKQGIRDSQEDNFDFEEAKNELKKIVDLANFSTRDAGDLSKKGAKTAWWDARAALDSRLKDLLINIENIWLGGFRGALKHRLTQSDFLARFQQSFNRTLDRHLPSRHKAKAPKGMGIVLDHRVLELFTMLGDPRDLEDSEEPILDLLYFVVDILQFNGERNAYDEIDFDPMVVEVQDALSHYHELAKAKDDPNQDGHVLLILDKRLHCFPWESLPCLSGQSVSRLPSLGCLRDRILMMQAQESSGSSFVVDRTNGAYILDPSSDLQHTRSTFEAPLCSLDGYSSIISKEPTETQLKETLSSKSLYLYFGHGSGGQYIRARTIRKLDRCAVSLLMGCSSGMLTEAGEYESYGTPINYLYAGAPAVVGTLWDVTDKDIDRFSIKVLEKWGLFSREEDTRSEDSGKSRSRSPVKKAPRGGKGKARQKSKTREKEAEMDRVAGEGKLTLDSAVAQARDACIMRYLNGAAPVVYGVPVSLS